MQESKDSSRFFATCPFGLAPTLAKELSDCDAHEIEPAQAGVGFSGTLETGYRATLSSRIASRVLLQVGAGRFRLDKDLYKLASKVAWEQHLHPRLSLRVDTKAVRVNLPSLKMASLRVKDAIVDRLRDSFDSRPDIDTHDPDSRVMVYLQDRQASFYVDLSGQSLFKRGWRGTDDKGAAPIKENLAAGLLACSQWPGNVALFDPFCGSGTIAIEAAQISRGVAPGLTRQFGAQQLQSFDALAWQSARQWAQQLPRHNGSPIFASDIDASMIELARANTRRARLPAQAIEFAVHDFLNQGPPCAQPGWIVSNLPYGERIGFGGAANDIGQLGQHLRSNFAGWTVCLLSNDLQLPRKLRLRERRKFALYNGTIDCRLFIFDMRTAP